MMGIRYLIKALAVFLVLATVAVLALAIGAPWLEQEALSQSESDRIWKIAVSFVTATGVVLGWLVTHNHSLKLATHNAQLAIARDLLSAESTLKNAALLETLKRVIALELSTHSAALGIARDLLSAESALKNSKLQATLKGLIDIELATHSAALGVARDLLSAQSTLKNSALLTSLKGVIDAQLAVVLEGHKFVSAAQLELFKQSLTAETIRLQRQAESDFSESRVKKELQDKAMANLERSVTLVKTRFSKLAAPSTGLDRDTLAELIDEALDARLQLKVARTGVQEAFGLVSITFAKLFEKYDAAIMDIIIEVRRAPERSRVSASQKALLQARPISSQMQAHRVRLETMSDYLVLLTQCIRRPQEFAEYQLNVPGRKGTLARLVAKTISTQALPGNPDRLKTGDA